jgi:hypothetical protein
MACSDQTKLSDVEKTAKKLDAADQTLHELIGKVCEPEAKFSCRPGDNDIKLDLPQPRRT